MKDILITNNTNIKFIDKIKESLTKCIKYLEEKSFSFLVCEYSYGINNPFFLFITESMSDWKTN